MSKPIAVVTSDTHLDDNAWSDRPEIWGDSMHAFDQICDYALKLRLPIIAAGDLIDKKKNEAGPIGHVRRWMDRLSEKNVGFYFIQGQHELQPSPWLSEIHSWPVWLTGCKSLLIGDKNFTGIDWTPADQIESELAGVPTDVDVLVMHQVCSEFMGDITSPELSIGSVPYAKLLIVGDFHEHKVLAARNRQGRNLRVLSPGSTNLRNIAEELPKRFFVLHDDLSVRSIKITSRPFLEVKIYLDEELDSFVEEIAGRLEQIANPALPEHLQVPILRVHYRIDIPNAYYRIAAAVSALAHLFTKELLPPTDETEEEAAVSAYQQEIKELGLKGCLPLALDCEDEPGPYRMLERLLNTDEPKMTIATLREEYGLGEEVSEEEGEEEVVAESGADTSDSDDYEEESEEESEDDDYEYE